jgi:hypothetical protein
VWQKTGWNTFAATFVAIEAENDAQHFVAIFFRFDKGQYTGKLSESGDQMDLTVQFSAYDINGNQIIAPDPVKNPPINFRGVRVPLEILPHTGTTLPVPVVSPHSGALIAFTSLPRRRNFLRTSTSLLEFANKVRTAMR